MSELDATYWSSRYNKDKTGWDVGYPTPPLIQYTKTKDKHIKILIPGAGNGYEALFLSQLGYKNIAVCDLSDIPLKYIKSKDVSESITTIHGDFFQLDQQFELILEQTFFCALDPKLRSKYVDKMYELLVNNGILAGVLFNKLFEQPGPPFGGKREEYFNLFSKKFNILHLEPCYNSIDPRQGSEFFIEFQKK